MNSYKNPLEYSDEEMRQFLLEYKKIRGLSYEMMAIMIGTSRETLSNYVRGKNVGTFFRRKLIRWCQTDLDTSSILFHEMFSNMTLANLPHDDEHFSSCKDITDSIASSIRSQLISISAITPSTQRISALKKLYSKIK